MAYSPREPPYLHFITQQSSQHVSLQSVTDTKPVPPAQYKAYSPHLPTPSSLNPDQELDSKLQQASSLQYKAYTPPNSQPQTVSSPSLASQSLTPPQVSQQDFSLQPKPLFSQGQPNPSPQPDCQAQPELQLADLAELQPTHYPLQEIRSHSACLSSETPQSQSPTVAVQTTQSPHLHLPPQGRPSELTQFSSLTSVSQNASYIPHVTTSQPGLTIPSNQPFQPTSFSPQVPEPQSVSHFPQTAQPQPILQSQPASYTPQTYQPQPGPYFPQFTQPQPGSDPSQSSQPQPASSSLQYPQPQPAISFSATPKSQAALFPWKLPESQQPASYPPSDAQISPPPPYSQRDPQSQPQQTSFFAQASKLQPNPHSPRSTQPQITSYDPRAFPPPPGSVSSPVQSCIVPSLDKPNASYPSFSQAYEQPPIPAAYEPARGPQDGYFASRQAQTQPSLDQKLDQSFNGLSINSQGSEFPLAGLPLTPGYTPTRGTPTSGYNLPPPLPPQQLPLTPDQTPSESTPVATVTIPLNDEVKSHWAKRFGGNMLLVRGARAGVTTVMSSIKLPAVLSPWGDNNPVTLPNVRKRDMVLMVGAHVGGDLIMGPAVQGLSFAGSVLAEAVIEQAVDQGILDKFSKDKDKILTTTSTKSLQFTIKHSLIGEDAVLKFFEESPTTYTEMMSCAKGWFCPYLYASGRTPRISRSSKFSVAQLCGPFLNSDSKLAHKLLAEGAATLSLCDFDPTHPINSIRMIVLFVGITPWRTSAWSQARIPGEARLRFHLINGCPAFVLPVTSAAPVCAWSSWTLKEMIAPEYSPKPQYESLFRFLDSCINLNAVEPGPKREKWSDYMAAGIKMIIQGAIQTRMIADPTVLGSIDPERAGIVMFRY